MRGIKKNCPFCKRKTFKLVKKDILTCNICEQVTGKADPEELKYKAIIVDLDECLADTQHRLPYILQQNPKDWSTYNSKIPEDKIYAWCKTLIKLFVKDGYKILFVTGRGEANRKATIDWLNKHDIVSSYILFMRKEGDYRPDFEIKKEIYFEYIEKNYKVLFALDDRSQNIKMWRSLGLVALQNKDGDY